MTTVINCILLIDDDAVTNMIHKKAIEKAHCAKQIQVVSSAEEALLYLTRDGKYEDVELYPAPNLIFLDINMPGLSGWDFLEEFKNLSEDIRQTLIIVMLSTSMNPDDAEKARTIKEVSGFKNKPLTIDMLDGIISDYFTEKI